MSEGFGREMPGPHVQTEHRAVTKYLVVIPAPEGPIAKLLLPDLVQVAEFDANTDDVTAMIKGRAHTVGATEAQWDKLRSGYSVEERATAMVYTLEL